ncbi:MAG: signal peptidase II [Bacilli bacterium]|nr:signal peptidase II [Bacilli bacterium]
MQLTRTFTKKEARSILLWMGLVVLLIGIDLLSKWLVELNLKVGELNVIIPNFLYFTKSYNVAIAFSLGSELPMALGRTINILISLVMSVLILWYWILHHEKLRIYEKICALLLASGAVGNLIDRAFYWEATTGFNGVIDFIQVYLGGGPSAPSGFFNPFATFNLADSYLVIGVIALLVIMVIDMIKDKSGGDMSKDPRLSSTPETIQEAEEYHENPER